MQGRGGGASLLERSVQPLQEQPEESALGPCREERQCPLASPLSIPGVLFTVVVAEGPATCIYK